MRTVLAALAVSVLFIGGLGAAAFAAGEETTGTVTACATASTPAHTIAVDGVNVHTVPGDTATQCETVTYTVPTFTGTTTLPTATTAPTTTEPPPPPPPSTNLLVSAAGNDANPCTQAAPCRSFARAWAVVQNGGTIDVSGSFGNQFFSGGYQSAQPCLNKTAGFRGLPGNKVRALHFGCGTLTFDGINVDAGATKTQGAAFENGGTPFTFRNGSIGNVVDEKGALVDGDGIVFDNVNFHDVVIASAGVHSECVYAIAVPGMTVRNSRFRNCAVMDILFTWPDWWNPPPPAYGDITLEGNTFGDPVGSCCSVYVGNTGPGGNTLAARERRNWTVRNNFFEDAPFADGAAVGGVYCGNTGLAPASWTQPC